MSRFMRFPGGLDKALTLSYDDGVVYDIRFSDIIGRKGLKCTFNINSGLFAEEGENSRRMSLSQAIELYKNSGHEVAVHAYTHPFLEQLSPQEVTYEVLKDRCELEKEFGVIVRGMAYPFGTYSDEVVDILKNCGIAYSRTTRSTEDFSMPKDWLRLQPTCHHRQPNLTELCDRFFAPRSGCNHAPWLFYLWGHTYEFNDNNNWEIIEEFTEKMGGREDIWYATNIEIYDYTASYNSLQFSCDSTICKNPTSTDVFFEQWGKDFCVKAGETVRLR